MQPTHIANPVRVNAERIEQVIVNPNLTINLKLEGSEKPFVPTPEMLARIEIKVGDYLVTQDDGYQYLNPKDVFERKYSQLFPIDAALQAAPVEIAFPSENILRIRMTALDQALRTPHIAADMAVAQAAKFESFLLTGSPAQEVTK